MKNVPTDIHLYLNTSYGNQRVDLRFGDRKYVSVVTTAA